MPDQDPYTGFKMRIGWVLLWSAVLYGVLVTILLMFFGTKVAGDALVWGFMTTIISTMMGWLMAKASTIIDNVWGSSRSSDVKGEYIIKESEDAKKLLLANVPDVPVAAVVTNPDSELLKSDTTAIPKPESDAAQPSQPVT